jgi:hypothetical protein
LESGGLETPKQTLQVNTQNNFQASVRISTMVLKSEDQDARLVVYGESKRLGAFHRVHRVLDKCPPPAEQEAPDFPFRFRSLAGQRTSTGKLFQRIKSVNQFFEPRRASKRSLIADPIVDELRIGLR